MSDTPESAATRERVHAHQRLLADRLSDLLPDGITFEFEDDLKPIDLAIPTPFVLDVATNTIVPRPGTQAPHCYKERRFGPWIHVDGDQPCRCMPSAAEPLVCLCGETLEADRSDHQYGTVWECQRCGQGYADE